MVLEKIKRVLDKNALLMSGMGLLFTYLSLVNGQEILGEGMNAKIMVWQGIGVLFVVYASETSKSLLLEEKISKKIEFLLANGVSLFKIIMENTWSLLMSVVIILLPAIGLILYKIQAVNTFELIDLIFTIITYSIIINIWILNTRNLNKMKTLQIKLIGLTILIQLISSGAFSLSNGVIEGLYVRYMLLGLLLAIMIGKLSKERIVESYY